MLKRAFFAFAALAMLTAAPARAFDISAMSDDEKVAFGQAVRAYLMDNPEVLVEVIDELEKQQQAAQAEGDATLIELHADALFNDANSHVAGNPDGDVTIVEFVDYRCSYCRQAFPEIDELVESDGNIRLILKEFPILGDQSLMAARFAISARLMFGDDAYGPLHDALMTMRANVTEDSLVAVAGDLGLDGQGILGGMDDPAVDRIIAANHQLAQLMQINGTPGFVVGDQVLRGYLPLPAMQQVVAEARNGG